MMVVLSCSLRASDGQKKDASESCFDHPLALTRRRDDTMTRLGEAMDPVMVFIW